MSEPPRGEPGTRENLRELLIASFEADTGLPSERGRRRRVPTIASVRIGGAESFFVGVFGGTAAGTAIGFYSIVLLEGARRAVHESITWLLPHPLLPSIYFLGGIFGAIVGIWMGCAMLAPWLESRRYRGKRYR